MPRAIAFVLPLLLLAAGRISMAQTSQSAISGFVLDSSGAVIPSVTVLVTNEGTNAVQRAVSDAAGFYVVPALPPGQYAVSCSMTGFKTLRQGDITLRVNQQLRVDLVLQPGDLKETVTVEAPPAQVDTRTGTLSEVVNHTQIVQLPLNGRNVMDLVTLQAGVVASQISGVTSYRSESNQVMNLTSATYNVSGARSNSVNFLIDGGSNVDAYTSVSSATPNPDAVQEFSMQKSGYGAEFARAGGVVNLVTRNGTNTLYGSAYDYLRNGALNARNFFAARRDLLIRNQFGFSAGGPVYLPKVYDGRNRTFFFFNYQGLRTNGNSSVGNVLTPTAAQRNGDLSDQKGPIIDPTTGNPFSNNQIPASRLDPSLQNLLKKAVPLPGPDDRFHYSSAISRQTDNEYNFRFDQNISDKNRIFVSYFRTNSFSGSPGLPNNVFNFGGGTGLNARHLAANDTHMFSPAVINTLTFSYIRHYKAYQAGDQKFNWADYGVKGLSNLAGSAGHGGFYTAVFSFAPALEEGAFGDAYQGNEALSWVRGPHEFKFGGDVFRNDEQGFSKWSTGGRFIFGSDFTKNGYGDLLLGLPTYFHQYAPSLNDFVRTTWSVYAQDTYKVSRRLSLTYGLRWEPYRNWREVEGRGLYWGIGERSSKFPNLPPNALVLGDSGVPAGIMSDQRGRFSPRFGFAFDPKGDGKWAFRGGYGVFKEVSFEAAGGREQAVGVPFVLGIVITPPKSLSDPYAGRQNPFPSPNGPFLASPATPIDLPMAGLSLFDPGFRNPYYQQWNFTIEHQLIGKILARAAYVGSKGTRLPRAVEVNPALYIPGADANGKPLSTTSNTQSRRVYQNYTNVGMLLGDGNSNYHGLQLTVEEPFSRNLQFKANYTYSKAIDDSNETFVGDSTGSKLRNPFNRSIDRASAQFNRRQVFVGSFVGRPWNPTRGNFLLRHVAGNWVMTGILVAQSGEPFTVLTGRDNSLQGPAFAIDTPDVVGNPNAPSGVADRRLGWFNTKAFVPNAVGTFGSAGRNIITGPGLFNLDAGVYKDFPLPRRENTYLQFRAEFFNFLNHTNFGFPNNNLSSPDVGKITSAGAPRIIQFALRLNF